MRALNNGKLLYCNNYDRFLYVGESVSSSTSDMQNMVWGEPEPVQNGIGM